VIITKCAICECYGNSIIKYDTNLPEIIDASVYAPRRKSDNYHFKLVECLNCKLVRSDPILGEKELSKMYFHSDCTYSDTHENIPLQITYGKYLKKILEEHHITKDGFLDIGCSNGFLLEEAKLLNFKFIRGVEPSHDSIIKAKSDIRPLIIEGMFDEKIFESEKFDIITFFQTFDHISNPNIFLKNCFRILKKEGYILAINHNVNSFSAKILGQKSPIFDIGHAYLYDMNTMKQIFEKNGFIVKDVFSVWNSITLKYFLHLLPLPLKIKNMLNKILKYLKLDSKIISLPLGNLGIIAQKLFK
jgi:SAM-dependent methyltransferase